LHFCLRRAIAVFASPPASSFLPGSEVSAAASAEALPVLLPEAACAVADVQSVEESLASAPADSGLAQDDSAALPADGLRAELLGDCWLAEGLRGQAPLRADSSRDES
jgi:hypothetical protein